MLLYILVWSGLVLLDQYWRVQNSLEQSNVNVELGWDGWISLTSLTTRSPYGDNNQVLSRYIQCIYYTLVPFERSKCQKIFMCWMHFCVFLYLYSLRGYSVKFNQHVYIRVYHEKMFFNKKKYVQPTTHQPGGFEGIQKNLWLICPRVT